MASRTEIIAAYRSLYRSGLRAVQFSTPARYTLRDRLRRAFRDGAPSDFEPHRIANTLEFLDLARKSAGQEHHVLRNLLLVWYWEPRQWQARYKATDAEDLAVRTRAYDGFYHTLRLLNESMGLCIR